MSNSQGPFLGVVMDAPLALSFQAPFEPFRPCGNFLLPEHMSEQFANLFCVVVIEPEHPAPRSHSETRGT